jgi:hypothetical protein
LSGISHTFPAGSIIELKVLSPGIYEATQLGQQEVPPSVSTMKSLVGKEIKVIRSRLGSTIGLDGALGVIRYVGTFDPRNSLLNISITLSGVTVGPLAGKVKDGLELKVDLTSVGGQITFCHKNPKQEDEVWAYYDLKFNSSDFKVHQKPLQGHHQLQLF